jgi:hypothetical protein
LIAINHQIDKSTNEMVCRCSSVVEHFLGKEEVDSSILFNGSKLGDRKGSAEHGTWRAKVDSSILFNGSGRICWSVD